MTCSICGCKWEPIVILNAGELAPTSSNCPICGFENDVEDDWELVEEI